MATATLYDAGMNQRFIVMLLISIAILCMVCKQQLLNAILLWAWNFVIFQRQTFKLILIYCTQYKLWSLYITHIFGRITYF